MWKAKGKTTRSNQSEYEFPTRKSKFYRKTLVHILLLASIPTALITAINYYVGTSQLEQEARMTQQVRFEQAINHLNETITNIEMWATREALSSSVVNLVSDNDFYGQTDLIKSVMHTLFSFKEANPHIKNVRLFSKEMSTLITGEDGLIKLTDEQIITSYESKIMASSRGLYWIDGLTYNNETQGNMSSSLIVKIPWYTSNPAGALIIDINDAELRTSLETIHGNTGFAMLLDASGDIIAGSGTDVISMKEELTNLSSQQLQLAEGINVRLNNEEYMLFEDMLPISSWRLISGVPLSHINGPAILTSRLLLISFFIVIAIIMIISYFTSNKLYSPIRRLMRLSESFVADDMKGLSLKAEGRVDEVEIIEKHWLHYVKQSEAVQLQMENRLPELRKVFLMQCLLGHANTFSEVEMMEKLSEYQFEVRGKGFTLVLVQLSGLSNTSTSFMQQDESLIQFTAANIVKEIAGNDNFTSEVIDLQNSVIGLLLFVPREQPRRTQIVEMSQRLSKTIAKIMKLNVSISVSRYYREFRHLSTALDEAYYGLQHRDFQLATQVLDIEKIVQQEVTLPIYPLDMEKAVLQALRSGSEQAAIEAINQFAYMLAEARGIEIMFKQGMFQLLGQMLNVIVNSGFDPYTLYERKDLYDSLNALKEPEEIVNWFKTTVIMPFIIKFNESHNIRMKQMVDAVLLLLHENYHRDISLDYCADMVNSTTFTLSKAFKEITGSNFIDYLTDFRLTKAKDLLQNSDLKVQEIAEKIGYQPPHFIRTFKRDTGTTPGKYREMHQQN